jgi:RNA polymerase sigma-70 factor (ECF subfamily)
LRAAAQLPAAEGQTALDVVLRRYQESVLNYLGFRFLVAREEAEDLWQGFVMRRILEKRLLTQVDPQRGRFRTFLVSSLNRFVLSELRRQHARKRCPAAGCVSLDTLGERELAHLAAPPADDTELGWAQAVIAGALLNMRADCVRAGAMEIWGVFEGRILSAILNDEPPTKYAELVRRFGFKSPTQTFNALTTAKRMFKRHLRQVIAQYSADDSEVEDELQALKQMLALRD